MDRENKNTFIMDIERCPYIGSDPEYEAWNRKDAERVTRISRTRTTLRRDAHMYLSHHDRVIREMAMFIIGFLEE